MILKTEAIENLRLSFSAGWRDKNLEFLKEVTAPRAGIDVYNHDIRDLSPIMRFSDLRSLSLSIDLRSKFDLAGFQNLDALYFRYSKNYLNLEKCSGLRYLNIENYPCDDLQPMSDMRSLQYLHLTSRKLSSLSPISKLAEIATLDLAYCPKLTDLTGIEELPGLRELKFYSCKSLGPIPTFSSNSKLEWIYFDKCGAIPSLDFLSNLRHLDRLAISETKISNGDLTPLTRLPKFSRLGISPGKYNLSQEDLASLVK